MNSTIANSNPFMIGLVQTRASLKSDKYYHNVLCCLYVKIYIQISCLFHTVKL